MLYLATTSTDRIFWAMRSGLLGAITSPRRGEDHILFESVGWAADNDCFSNAGAFDYDRYMEWLDEFSQPARENCLFIVVPDVVADAEATRERWELYAPKLEQQGLPLAFVAQDGITDDMVPWDQADVLFIGGSTRFKLSRQAVGLLCEAQRRGLRTHVGRVNSKRRVTWCAGARVDTVDGTHLTYGPDKKLPELLRWMESTKHDQSIKEWAMASWLARGR